MNELYWGKYKYIFWGVSLISIRKRVSIIVSVYIKVVYVFWIGNFDYLFYMCFFYSYI